MSAGDLLYLPDSVHEKPSDFRISPHWSGGQPARSGKTCKRREVNQLFPQLYTRIFDRFHFYFRFYKKSGKIFNPLR